MHIFSKNKILDLNSTKVMGILNVTPDSFYDGGKYNKFSLVINQVRRMIKEGADIIDIGGESTRPGANRVSTQEEIERVVPIVKAISERFDTFISVDTSNSLVMKECEKNGAHLINDVRALKNFNSILTIANIKIPVCLVHMKGNPNNMQNFPYYKDVIEEIKSFFRKKIKTCVLNGIKRNQLLLDPGFGFGKNLYHNYHILSRLSEFHCFNLPLLVGMSNKSMIKKIINLPIKEQMSGNIACAVIAAMQGVNIIRVHNVKQTIKALQIVQATLFSKKKINE